MLQGSSQTRRPSKWQVRKAPDYAPTLEAELPRQAIGPEVHFAAPNGKRLSDAPPKQAKRTGAGGVG